MQSKSERAYFVEKAGWETAEGYDTSSFFMLVRQKKG